MDDHAIRSFWDFWAANRGRIERAIDERTLGSWVDRISEHVHAIDERLAWEFGAGRSAKHYFCLSAEGDIDARIVAERWLAGAPASDSVFEYWPARPGGGRWRGLTLKVDDVSFAKEEFRLALDVDQTRARVHIAAWHPAFASAAAGVRATAVFISLDSVLGEDVVERWLGGIEIIDAEPGGGTNLGALVDAVKDLAAAPADSHFAIVDGKLANGAPWVATVDFGVKRVDHLLLDAHIEVDMRLRDPSEVGLANDTEASELNVAEDSLIERLGADAVWIARETRDAHRVIHFHGASNGPVVARARAWASDLAWHVEVRSHPDPRWEILTRW